MGLRSLGAIGEARGAFLGQRSEVQNVGQNNCLAVEVDVSLGALRSLYNRLGDWQESLRVKTKCEGVTPFPLLQGESREQAPGIPAPSGR